MTAPTQPLASGTPIDEIIENFQMLDDWEDRYGYLIELGRDLTPIAESEMNDANKVNGCVSQVWVVPYIDGSGILSFQGASDAHIVRGLVAIALTLFSGKNSADVLATDEQGVFGKIGLAEHLTPQRSNGLRSMVTRIKELARATNSGSGEA